ncbi:Eco57I restriction-modification methylase domain-containing protein [Aphanizomenon flos-aquae]|uniref:site-specific DNA-methyltransferase (adenine-specific) n=1 Tax=Aphanizomenon flos-aquae FACHB-1040 TaxID=2692887 RepID=A0ABR8BR02_APHFL|nr:N-6 DNA methylase [Aphanizomenon flos-aquae]MBD2277348.1 N-6 DNA methylase [Aphanizomenon flos-aquae FACHB-1040]
MKTYLQTSTNKRYQNVSEEKLDGATYTPSILADFLAEKIIDIVKQRDFSSPIKILDPAVGDGQLLLSLLRSFENIEKFNLEIYGFDTNSHALEIAKDKIKQEFPKIICNFWNENFLEFVSPQLDNYRTLNLFEPIFEQSYHVVIANPPYVRTQIIGGTQAQKIAKQFGLSGRVDIYYAFILGIASILHPQGVAGIITSNRFMTVKSGISVRKAILNNFNIRHVWDLGDTKLFSAAVLPAVLLVEGRNTLKENFTAFTSIYETKNPAQEFADNPIEAISKQGNIKISDGRSFLVQHGELNSNINNGGIWSITTAKIDSWLKTVESHTWATFRDIGDIRVGVKTCADKVFICSDWQKMSEVEKPELLKSLTTHHIARQFKPVETKQPKQILYPHEVIEGHRNAVDISLYPRSKAYLELYRTQLEDRKYVINAGRKWYEIWVPQDPAAWQYPKLVFRDISEKPTFWIDLSGSVINGDCYWLMSKNPQNIDLLWLAVAVANSTFIENFYDYRFHNKLYAGRRRFMTQYVEHFPIPNPQSYIGRAIIQKAKDIYNVIPSLEADITWRELDSMIWESFGLAIEEISR